MGGGGGGGEVNQQSFVWAGSKVHPLTLLYSIMFHLEKAASSTQGHPTII